MEVFAEFNQASTGIGDNKKITKENINIKLMKDKDGKTFCNIFVNVGGRMVGIMPDKAKHMQGLIESIGVKLIGNSGKTHDIECEVRSYEHFTMKEHARRKRHKTENGVKGISKVSRSISSKYKRSKDRKIVKEICEKMKKFEDPVTSYRILLASVFTEIFSMESSNPGSYVDSKHRKMEVLKSVYPHMFEK